MLSEDKIKQIREELDNCKNPLFFFHDDSDGLASFLLLYRYVREGHGIIVKSDPRVDEKFVRKVEEYKPDKIFVLDLAGLSQEFVDLVKTPIIWIDHHPGSEKINNVKQFNPRLDNEKDGSPVSAICYNVVKQDLWIAAAGIIGDWNLSKETEEFSKKYPSLLPPTVKKPEKALFETKIGELARIFNFILKGKTQDAMRSVKVMTRINGPEEILDQTTTQGSFIHKKYKKVYRKYQELLQEAEKKVTDDKVFVFPYEESRMSFSGELSNEFLYKYPDKIIIIAREKEGEMKCSLRSGTVPISGRLKNALVGIEGRGGGHEYACGAVIKKRDFEQFINNLKRQLNI
ncbi:DHHA1 domain-containing protein [Nanoarchaeota archaeon]